ncbi:uncharacterized protein LOC106384346 [Brassica napus]|uniref:uncharacterized protein LOC106384346 n=1 Tax=Brassica napus TaxID=3708 RepID=UPI0006AAAAED|nr:uncharacterized protein LOC106384346 [Brassica napus]
MPPSLNETHVRLIPKIQGAKKVEEYRPIALCNVYYKVISKLLSLRLKPILKEIISENKSAFIHGRAITDNVLITHEVLQYLKTSQAKKQCSMAVKMDMSKAYDRVEWDFIAQVMSRQAELDGSMKGIRVARGSPRVNHLLFADDTMMFCNSSQESCLALIQILHNYEKVSGQKVNISKSSITFSVKTPQEKKDSAKSILGIEKEGGACKYLGKLTMLKAVLTAIPTYPISCFQLPVSLCKRIQSTLTRFLWDNSTYKKKCVGWPGISQPSPKLQGESDYEIFNYPVKPYWLKDLLKENLGKAIGNGHNTRIWKDSWISLHEFTKPMGPIHESALDLRVSDLLTDDLQWNKIRIQQFLHEFSSQIQCIKPSKVRAEDVFVWLPLDTGIYSTKSWYNTQAKQCLSPSRPLAAPTLSQPNLEFIWIKDVW